jgi:hypothetical protein
MFPCMIVEAETLDVFSNGIDGTKIGSIQLVFSDMKISFYKIYCNMIYIY